MHLTTSELTRIRLENYYLKNQINKLALKVRPTF